MVLIALKCNIEIPSEHPLTLIRCMDAAGEQVEKGKACLVEVTLPGPWNTGTSLCGAGIKKASLHVCRLAFKMEAPTRFELVIKVLQTSALPLGDGAEFVSLAYPA